MIRLLGEVTAHRDRLRDMLNDIRGLLLCPPADLECQIMRRIEDGKPIEKPVGEGRVCLECGDPRPCPKHSETLKRKCEHSWWDKREVIGGTALVCLVCGVQQGS